jgi:hypothetical protein
MARGKPSSFRQISATAPALRSLKSKAGFTARARATKRATLSLAISAAARAVALA